MSNSTEITNRRRLAFGEKDELMNMSRIRFPLNEPVPALEGGFPL